MLLPDGSKCIQARKLLSSSNEFISPFSVYILTKAQLGLALNLKPNLNLEIRTNNLIFNNTSHSVRPTITYLADE
jgi:hypothetical protein